MELSTPTNTTSRQIDELDEAIGKLSREINIANHQLMVMIRQFDELAGWSRWGFADSVSWLKWRCDLNHNTAREKLRVAHALHHLPQISDEFSRGKLSYSKVRALTRVATPETESDLIAMAHKMPAAQVVEHCRQRRNASKRSTKLAVDAHATRFLRSWCNEGRGVLVITMELPIEEGGVFEKAIDKAAANLSAETLHCDVANQDKASWSAVRADAAVAIAKEYLCNFTEGDEGSVDSEDNAREEGSVRKTLSSSTADHYQVMIHVDEAALSGRLSEAGESTGKSELPIESIRRLCCDGSIISVVENVAGEPLNVGRKVRTVTSAIRRALWARDRGCVFPGCTHTRFVDAHHIKHWADGGETSLQNLVLLCTQHHRMVHEGGYSVHSDQQGGFYFSRPDGRAVPASGYREKWSSSLHACDNDASKNSAEFLGVEEMGAEYCIWEKHWDQYV